MRSAARPNKNHFPRAPPAAGSAQFPIRGHYVTRAPGPTVLRHPIGQHRPKLLGWDEILQAVATAAIGRSVRPVHQSKRTSVPLLRRSVAPSRAGRGTGGSSGSHPVDGWRRDPPVRSVRSCRYFDRRTAVLETFSRLGYSGDSNARSHPFEAATAGGVLSVDAGAPRLLGTHTLQLRLTDSRTDTSLW